MGSTNVATPFVWPSQNDINGGVSGDGKHMLEKYARELWGDLNGISYVVSGGALPASAANLVLIVPAGVAIISGLLVKWAQTNVTLPASNTSHIFVKLTFSASLSTGIQIEDNTTGTHPADSIKLGTATTSGAAITSTVDQRLLDGNQRIRRVVITATGTTNWIVPANVTKARLRQWGPGGGGGGGGGGDGIAAGGAGAAGNHGGYWEAVITVTPGSTLTIVNGVGGSPGSAGIFNGNGGDGGSGGDSTVSGPGFSFKATGGPGGPGGITGSGSGTQRHWNFQHAEGLVVSGALTLDMAIDGGGRGPGIAGAGGSVSGSGFVGGAGESGRTIIEY